VGGNDRGLPAGKTDEVFCRAGVTMPVYWQTRRLATRTGDIGARAQGFLHLKAAKV
jgi:hypothetical protein